MTEVFQFYDSPIKRLDILRKIFKKNMVSIL